MQYTTWFGKGRAVKVDVNGIRFVFCSADRGNEYARSALPPQGYSDADLRIVAQGLIAENDRLVTIGNARPFALGSVIHKAIPDRH